MIVPVIIFGILYSFICYKIAYENYRWYSWERDLMEQDDGSVECPDGWVAKQRTCVLIQY